LGDVLLISAIVGVAPLAEIATDTADGEMNFGERNADAEADVPIVSTS
jgi:hypothetical protein